MERFERNCKLLGIVDPASLRLVPIDPANPPEGYRIEAAGERGVVITVHGRALGSRYDAVQEADRLIAGIVSFKKNVYLFFGLGSGMHLVRFAEQRKRLLGVRDYRAVRIIIFDFDPTAVSCALSTVDFSPLAAFSVSFFLIGEHTNELPATLVRKMDAASVKGVTAVVHPSLSRGRKATAMRLHGDYCARLEREYANLITRFHFESVWTRNCIRNADALGKSADVSSFAGRFSGIPAVIAASGPTLADSFDALRDERSGFALIAVDTAYAPLVKHGIIPDFVVSLDAGFYNYYDFIIERSPFPYLATDCAVFPAILRNPRAKTIVFRHTATDGADFPAFLAAKARAAVSEIFCSDTIASAAIDFAARLGFSPVLLIGHDCSFPRYETHCVHASAYEYFLARATRLAPLPSLFAATVRSRSHAEAGDYPPADFTLFRQRQWYGTLTAAYPGMTIGRITGDAAPVLGIPETSIAAIAKPGARERTIEIADHSWTIRKIDASALHKYYRQAADLLGEIIDELSRSLSALPKMKGDPAAIETLLADASRFVQARAAEIPFLESGLLYVQFSINRREGDSPKTTAYMFCSELLKLAVYFRSRFLNEIHPPDGLNDLACPND